MSHTGIPPGGGASREYGDARSPGSRLRDALPDACARLDMFQWEWVREHDIEPVSGWRRGAEWVAEHSKPVSCQTGINREGLAEASEQVARWVQAALHADGDEPLELGAAMSLYVARLSYVNALYWLGGDDLWKSVEERVAPNGEPLAICMGSLKPVDVTVFPRAGPMSYTMQGYPGCLRTFTRLEHGRGRPWATWCPRCRPGKTNAKNRAASKVQRRAAELWR